MKDENLSETTFLSFIIGSEKFAVNVGKVLEVQQKQTITPVPQAPDFYKGVINFRGEIIPVIDTRLKFGLQSHDETEKYVIIVLEIDCGTEKFTAGAIADKVKDVIPIRPDEILPVPKMNKTYNVEFFHGIVNQNNSFVMLINFDKLFSSEDIISITEIAENTQLDKTA